MIRIFFALLAISLAIKVGFAYWHARNTARITDRRFSADCFLNILFPLYSFDWPIELKDYRERIAIQDVLLNHVLVYSAIVILLLLAFVR